MKQSSYMSPHEEWIVKAEHDLLSAKKLFETGLYDTAIFHTQQCAEKSLKGFLAFKRLPLQKTHDLVLLNNLCKDIDNSFVQMEDECVFLNSRDIQFRYPSEELNPTHEEITQAIAYASTIFAFVKSLLKNKSL